MVDYKYIITENTITVFHKDGRSFIQNSHIQFNEIKQALIDKQPIDKINNLINEELIKELKEFLLQPKEFME